MESLTQEKDKLVQMGSIKTKDQALAVESLGVIMSKLIHLFFNYQPWLVSLELTQNICEGRDSCVNILTNKRSKDLSK